MKPKLVGNFSINMACVVCHQIYSANNDVQVDTDEKPHLCSICGLSFTFKIQLKRHAVLHANGAPYTCKYCVKENESEGKSYNLRLGNKSEYTCEVCLKSFSNKRMLLRHSIQHTYESDDGLEENIKITIKKRSASSNSKHSPKKCAEPVKFSLKRHWSHSTSKNKTFICDICNRGFAYQACLDKHIKTGKCSMQSSSKQSPKHSNENAKNSHEDLPCNSKDVEYKCNLGSNTETTDVKKHVCSVCGKTFARKSSLDGHELSHILNKEASEDEVCFFSDSEIEDEDVSLRKKPKISSFRFQRSYTCQNCNFVCFSKQTLDKHMTNHQQEDLQSPKVSESGKANIKNFDLLQEKTPDNSKSFKEFEKKIGGISYKCEKCNKKFKKETKFLKHNCHDKKDDTRIKENTQSFVCKVCSETFDSKKGLKHHFLNHVEGNTDDSSLEKKDVFIKHGTKRSKNFACDICGRRFVGEICLKKHQEKHKHDDKNSISTATELVSAPTRVKKVKPAKELICEYCNEEFTGKRSAYVKHVHAHTPEVCGICDDRFVDRQSLREHCKIHIGTEEGKMFVQCSQKALDAKNGVLVPEPKVEYIYLVLR